MTTYAWPNFGVERFEMRVVPNGRVFSSPLTKQTQAVSTPGERWGGMIQINRIFDAIEAGTREAFADRLEGRANPFSIWNFWRPQPLGTFRDGVTCTVQNSSLATILVKNSSLTTITTLSQYPSVREVPLQFAPTVVFTNPPGRTVQPGDMIGAIDGTQKQLCRAMAAATADANGRIEVEVLPRPRWQWSLSSIVVWDKPTVDVILRSGDEIPMAHDRALTDGAQFDYIEA